MTFRAETFLAAILLSCTPTAIFAQTVADIELGETRQQKTGDTSDLYRFSGLTGTTVTGTLTTTGDAALVFYTPDGEEMISAKGKSLIKLNLVLPFPDVYFVSVLRGDVTNQYTLKLDGMLPDDHLAVASYGIGFERIMDPDPKSYSMFSCWIEPGIKFREIWPKGIGDVLIGRGGREAGSWKSKDGRLRAKERVVKFEGSSIIYHWPDGSQKDFVTTWPTKGRERFGRYSGYLCDDGLPPNP